MSEETLKVDERFEPWEKWYCAFCGGWHAIDLGLPLPERGFVVGEGE